MITISDSHPYLKISEELSNFIIPLRLLKITHFSYLKNYHNGLQVNLSSSPLWIKHYYQEKLYCTSNFEANPKSYDLSYTLWSSFLSDSKVILDGRDYFNSDHGITLINPVHDGCEFYFFSGAANNFSLHNVLINNFDLLQRFILFFKDSFSKNIRALEKRALLFKRESTFSSR